jgi:glucose/arabinose dehydrogenase
MELRRTAFILIAILAAIPVSAQDFPSRAGHLHAVQVAGPFAFPWCVAWLPDGTPLVTERDGKLDVIRNGRSLSVAGVPTVAVGGQGGLFDVLVLPLSEGRQDILLSYAWEDTEGKSLRVARATLAGSDSAGWRLEGLKPIFDLLPRSPGPIQFGGRLALLADETLLIATGDRGPMNRAQLPGDDAGKIHHIRLDGTIPKDNPFVGQPGWRPTIWTLGHRNIEGLWVDPVSNSVWASEHGPQGGDEINIILRGRNYGWPVITYGVNYGTGTKIGEGTAKPGMEQPVLYWKPSIAPSGLTYYNGDRYPGWKGSFISGALAGRGISRFRIGTDASVPQTAPDRATIPPGAPAILYEEEFLPSGDLGRIRDVRTGPDGYLYLTTDSPHGALYRLESVS